MRAANLEEPGHGRAGAGHMGPCLAVGNDRTWRDAQGMQYGRLQVRRRDRCVQHVGGPVVAGAADLPAAQFAARTVGLLPRLKLLASQGSSMVDRTGEDPKNSSVTAGARMDRV